MEQKYFEKTPFGVFHHFSNVKTFTAEEIEAANAKEKAVNETALEEALADGFIHFPIFFRDVNGVLTELSSWIPPTFEPSCSEGFEERHGMSYNIYVPSYKRAGNAATIDMLRTFGANNWYLAVDPSQYADYKREYGAEHIILRDIRFRDPSMVDLATSIPRPNSMSGTAGVYNNLLAFSRTMGEEKYFTMDDDFYGLAMKAKKGFRNKLPDEIYVKDDYYRCSNIKEEYGFNFQEFMRGIETVGKAMRNHGFLGLEKFGVVFSLCAQWKFGTRVYSFYLSDNKTQPTHRAAMNNDVITSMEQSKRGLMPGLFELIGYNSGATQTTGGLTDQYLLLGTLEKTKILVKMEPNFTKIVINYNRIHHLGDFTTYNRQRIVGVPLKGENSPYYRSED
jgi:hypothetical protein